MSNSNNEDHSYPSNFEEINEQPSKEKVMEDLIVKYTILGSRCDLILHKIKMKKYR